ncbi:putative transcriptional regulator [Bradyrhizobium sp. LB7.1]
MADRDVGTRYEANPVERVRELIEANRNYFPELEQAAETLRDELNVPAEELYAALAARLREKHSIQTRIMPVDVMRETLRRFDRHRRQLLISELVDAPGRAFQLAFQLGLGECAQQLETIIGRAGPLDDTPRRLFRITLGNYFAAAVMMPYPAFLAAAEALNYDIHLLAQRFNSGFEQVCHRLTTLQRPNARGIPFFLLRVDNAGNVSKRFSSGTFPFSKFGGTCPLWNVHSTFDTPDRLLKQVIELSDGTRYFSIAQMVRRPVAPHPLPQPRFAIGLGCEIRHAARLVYAAGIDLEKNRGHADRRQLPPLRARKLRSARGAADHAHADPGRDDAAGVEFRVLECEGAVRHTAVMPREGGASSTPRPIGSIAAVSEYWIARSSRAMTVECAAAPKSYASVCTITGPAAARASPASSGPRSFSIQAIARRFASSACSNLSKIEIAVTVSSPA